MADETTVGINIAVSAGELKTLIKSLQESEARAKAAKTGMQVFVDSVKQAGSSFAAGAEHATRLHHALRLMHRLAEPLKAVFEHLKASLSESLAMRGPGDALKTGAEKIQGAMERFNNAGLNKLAPLFQGIAEVLGGLVSQYEAWSKANQKVQRTEVIEWFVKLANILVTVVAGGLSILVKAWYGVDIAVNTVRDVVEKFWAGMLDGIADGLEAFSKFYGFFKKDNALSKALQDGANAVRGLGAEFDRSGDEAQAAIMSDVRAMDEMQAGIDKAEGIVRKAIGDVAVSAYKHLGDATHEYSEANRKAFEELLAYQTKELRILGAGYEAQQIIIKGVGELTEANYRQAEAIEKAHAADLKRIIDIAKETVTVGDLEVAWGRFENVRNRISKDEEIAAKKDLQSLSKTVAEKQIATDLEQKNIANIFLAYSHLYDRKAEMQAKDFDDLRRTLDKEASAVAQKLGDGIGRTFAGIITGTQSVQQAFDDMLKAMLERAIAFLAEEAIITLLTLLTGGTLSGATLGFGTIAQGVGTVGKLLGFASGGMVGGGYPGRDSVPAMLTPGEYVLPVDVVKSIQGSSAPRDRGMYASGGFVTSASSSTTHSTTLHVQNDVRILAPLTQSSADRMWRDSMRPSQIRLRRAGYPV
jgi:hypothetical protein